MISFVCQMSFEKTCEWCGKQFQTKRYPTKFCSQSCYFKNRAAAKNQRKIQLIKQYDSSLDVVCEGSRMFYRKICDHCGKEFLAPRSNGRFCCTKCHDSHKRKKQAEYKHIVTSEERHNILKGKFLPLKKFCAYCGVQFTAYKQTTMFCCSACARKYRIRQDMAEHATKVTNESLERENLRLINMFANKDVLRVSEAAEFLSVSRESIYRYISKGIISPVVLPGITLISKDSLTDLFKEGTRFREASSRAKKQHKIPELKSSPVFLHTDEFISITEASEVYEIPLNVMQHWLRRSELSFERFRNIRFYRREDVDSLVRKRQRDSHPEITDWYTVDEIICEFGMSRKQVYNFTGTHRNIPKKKESGITYYSKKHIDNLLKHKVDPEEYYTASEVSERYGIEISRLYKIAKRMRFTSYHTSGRIWYKKTDVDVFFHTEYDA